MNRKYAFAVPLLALPLLAACHSSGKTTAEASSAKASASAFASSAQGKADKAEAQKLVKKCFPASESAQLKLAEPVKGKTARKSVEACFNGVIPAKNRTAFDDALLNAVIHGHVKTHAGRETLVTVTIPGLVVKYQ